MNKLRTQVHNLFMVPDPYSRLGEKIKDFSIAEILLTHSYAVERKYEGLV